MGVENCEIKGFLESLVPGFLVPAGKFRGGKERMPGLSAVRGESSEKCSDQRESLSAGSVLSS